MTATSIGSPLAAGLPLPERERVRHTHTAKGLLLELPRTGMVVVPFEQHRGGWNVVVVQADARGVYPPSGYCLSIGDDEIESAVERTLAPAG